MTHVLLGIAVFSTGLFTGLLMTVKFFFERALRDLSGPGFAPVAVLVMMRESLGSAAFMLTAAGLLAFWGGSILPSTFFAQPLYGVFLSWEVAAPPQDWREARDRYFRVNAVRGVGWAVAFVCFVTAAMIV